MPTLLYHSCDFCGARMIYPYARLTNMNGYEINMCRTCFSVAKIAIARELGNPSDILEVEVDYEQD